MPRSPQPGPNASIRAAGLVLTLFATAAGAAGAAQLTPAQVEPPEVVPPVPPIELDTHLDAHARRLDIERWNRALASRQEVERFESLVSAHEEAERVAQRVAQRIAMWDELAHCETGGNWYDGGEYGGGLGIYVGTWRMYGGHEIAAKPQWATKAQQIEVAERIAQDGYGGWGCARRLGWVD